MYGYHALCRCAIGCYELLLAELYPWDQAEKGIYQVIQSSLTQEQDTILSLIGFWKDFDNFKEFVLT